jgi:hypothetical protein
MDELKRHLAPVALAPFHPEGPARQKWTSLSAKPPVMPDGAYITGLNTGFFHAKGTDLRSENSRSSMYGIIESWRREHDMAPIYASKYRGHMIQRSVMVDELPLEQDRMRTGVSWITPRTRYTYFTSLSRIA